MKDIELLREALAHALICPLAQDCYRIMRDEPEKITACDGCRRMLIVWKIQIVELQREALRATGPEKQAWKFRALEKQE